MQNFTWYSDANVQKHLIEFKCNLLSFELIYRYWNQVHNKNENLFNISLESEQK